MIVSISKSDLELYVKVKDYEEAKLKAYHQGRADAEAEWKSLPNEYADRLAEQSYQRGRRDAIEEILGRLSKVALKSYTPNLISMDEVRIVLEQMKGETCD